MNWIKKSNRPNSLLILDNDDFISFNPMTAAPLGLDLLMSDNDAAETALNWNDKFYILNGDFRKEYEEAIEKYGKDAEALAYAVFYQNTDEASTWSEHAVVTRAWIEAWLSERRKNIINL